MGDPLDRAADDLGYIADMWGDLQVMRLTGTPLPWAMTRLTDEQRQAAADRDRAERADRNHEAPGVTAAPLRIQILDVILDVEQTLADLEQAVLEAVDRTRTGRQPPRRTVPGRVRWLADSRPACVRHGLTDRVAVDAGRLAIQIRTALRDTPASLPLTGAKCIACGLEKLTLRHGTDPHRDSSVICENPHCEPTSAQCGNRDRRNRPMWPAHELGWLADQLQTKDVA